VDVVPWVIGRVELDDPIYSGDVETSSGNVRAEQDTSGRIAELEESVGPFLLFLLALERSQKGSK
jgi:hypothetical protein